MSWLAIARRRVVVAIQCFQAAQQPGPTPKHSNRRRRGIEHKHLRQMRWRVLAQGTSHPPRRCPVLPIGTATDGDEGAGRECLPCWYGSAARVVAGRPAPSPGPTWRRRSNTMLTSEVIGLYTTTLTYNVHTPLNRKCHEFSCIYMLGSLKMKMCT